jgi:hypothetical protein
LSRQSLRVVLYSFDSMDLASLSWAVPVEQHHTPGSILLFQRCQLRSLSSALSLFSGLVVDPNISSCRQYLFMSYRSQHLFMSTASTHVESYLHIDLILSCRPRTSMSTSYFHVDPHTFMSTPTSLLVDIDFHLLLSISRHLCVHLFHVEHIIKYIIDVSQVYHRCRPSTSSMSTKYTIDDVDLVHHAASTFDAQYEGILPVTLTFRLWSTLLSTTIVSRMSFLLS